MAVPKKKVSRVRTKRRYACHVKRVQKLLNNKTHLIACTHCGVQKLLHHVCAACGYYGTRMVMNVKGDKSSVTKIEA